MLDRVFLWRRIQEVDNMNKAVNANVSKRKEVAAPVNWSYTAGDARLKLLRFYPWHP